MDAYLKVNQLLTNRRNHAKNSSSQQGPRVIVVGPNDSGRSILSRMLVNWAANLGWTPTLVDLNIEKGSLTFPGCIAAMEIEFPIIHPAKMVPRGNSTTKDTKGTENLVANIPALYFFGHTNPCQNVKLYKVLVKELAKKVERRFAVDVESRTAGMVINTLAWKEGVGHDELLLHVIEAYNANVVLVLGQEKLFNMLSSELKNRPNVDVVNLPKSGGVVSSSKAAREKARSDRIREYFYGRNTEVGPHAHIAKFSEVRIYRIDDGGPPQATTGSLQIGGQQRVANSPLKLMLVSFGQHLVRQVLAVSFTMEKEKIITSNVAGVIYIIAIDKRRHKLAYLSPSSSGELPSRNLIMGSLTWVDNKEH